MMTDPISDLLTRIRNANKIGQPYVEAPYSNLKWAIVNLLKEEGFLGNCEIVDEKERSYKQIKITLKYSPSRKRVISGLRRYSKPGRRLYVAVKDLKQYRKSFGVTLLSTQKGIMTDKRAVREKTGGEVVCSVW